MINWNEKHETGHELIDAHHRILILYVNRLETMCQTTNPRKEEVELFVRFMEFLEDFILEHFREEEVCMHRLQCPAYLEAQATHHEFLIYYLEMKQRFGINGYRAELVRELFEACVSFIQSHIFGSEAQLRLCKTELTAAGSN